MPWHTDRVAAALESSLPGEAETDIISLTIPASHRFVRLVRIGIASLARRKGLSVRAIDDLRLAVDETFTLLLGEDDRDGHVDVTFEVDDHELLVVAQQRLAGGALPISEEAAVRFEVVMTDLVSRVEADPVSGVVQFSRSL